MKKEVQMFGYFSSTLPSRGVWASKYYLVTTNVGPFIQIKLRRLKCLASKTHDIDNNTG